ncbi:ureidoglycolate lyase [Sulfitobacter sp. EhC04]|uniref:ureidoglycolate lyase n=1 Tax=Sulfitobacter sp. EhC04 TaxID=1849168 RepID=UPI000AB6E29F|nr:ureidoglycolate lyase [Sulfitobacter sp. EhC04]
MTIHLKLEKLSAVSFEPYGDLLDASGAPDKIINRGKCGRYHDRAHLDFSDGRAGISIFKGEMESLPLKLKMVERHPKGSQAFVPMSANSFLVVVCQDDNGIPVDPKAFLTEPGQAINFHRGIWHGVLAPLSETGLFAVIDRIGEGTNLEEYWFEQDYLIE